jgi:hypothetical protein
MAEQTPGSGKVQRPMFYPFRVFISYSHEDRALAQAAAEALVAMGLAPVWDMHIRPGAPFTEAIKGLIHHAHIFMPIITEHASHRPWVHQETGYAMALNIPILPIAVDTVPGEMAAQLQAVVVCADFSDFAERLASVDLEQVVSQPAASALRDVEVTSYAENRAEMLARCAQRVIEMGAFGRVRQRAALSTFSIPDRAPGDPIWAKREGDVQRSAFYHNLQRAERRILEQHARQAGCDLIIDPEFSLERNGPSATRTRLEILLKFIESMPDALLRVVMTPRAREANLTLIGDWFSAESMSPKPGEGHRQTVFTWHAPTVLQTLRAFDDEFAELCAESPEGATRQAAIARIGAILARERTA